MSSVQRASLVNDPLTFFIEHCPHLPLTGRLCRAPLTSVLLHHVGDQNLHIFLIVGMDLCHLYLCNDKSKVNLVIET